jgi:hypothetical protein
MRAKAKFTIDVSSTIMKNAAPVATAGIQFSEEFTERVLNIDVVTL